MQSPNTDTNDIMIHAEGIRFSGHESLISFHWIGFPKAGREYQVRIKLKRHGEPSVPIILAPYLSLDDIPSKLFDERPILLRKLVDIVGDDDRTPVGTEIVLRAVFSTYGMLRVSFDRDADDEFLIFQLLMDDIPNLPSFRCAMNDGLRRFFSRIAVIA
jgi:hypothetical protein